MLTIHYSKQINPLHNTFIIEHLKDRLRESFLNPLHGVWSNRRLLGFMNNTLIREVIETEDDRETVETELNRILRCRRFSNAPQMSAFLDYIVRQTLEGNANRIKAYTVGVDALGKPPTFDAQGDPSVRVLAMRLRKTLVQMYETSEPSALQIQMRVGSYVPEFIKCPAPAVNSQRPLALVNGPASLAKYRESGIAPTRQVPSRFRPTEQRSGQSSRSSDPANRGSVGNRSSARSLPARYPSTLIWLAFSTLIILVAWLSIVSTQPALASFSRSMSSQESTSQDSTGQESTGFFSDAETGNKNIDISFNWSDRTGQRGHLRRVSALLSSSFFEADNFNVIRSGPYSPAMKREDSTYELALSKINVGEQSYVNAQLISVVSGAILSSKTLTFDIHAKRFSAFEIDQITNLVNEMKSPSGPLMNDFCSDTVSVISIACSS